MEKAKRFLGVNKRVMKKSYKKRLLNQVVDYLKSDYYMFAPLVSSPPLDVSTTLKFSGSAYSGDEVALPSEGRNKKLLKKVEEYLKSDPYMYAPMVGPQSSKIGLAPPLKGATTTSISPKKIFKEIEQPSKSIEKVPTNKGTVVRETIALRETVKHMVHRNCRSSTVPGKKVLEKRQRKLVE